MNRQLQQIAEENQELIKQTHQLSYAVYESIEHSKVVAPSEVPLYNRVEEGRALPIAVTLDDSITAALKLIDEGKYPCILNFASAKHPGGMYMLGSSAQEEALCRSTTLYPVLVAHDHVYETSRTRLNNALYSDWAIYSPNIIIFRDGDNRMLDGFHRRCSIITCAAPNAGVARLRGITEDKIEEVLTNRCRLVLQTAILNGDKNLILGAYGCGVFKNNPHVVARVWRKTISECKDRFDEIIFAIKGKGENYMSFKNDFVEGEL